MAVESRINTTNKRSFIDGSPYDLSQALEQTHAREQQIRFHLRFAAL